MKGSLLFLNFNKLTDELIVLDTEMYVWHLIYPDDTANLWTTQQQLQTRLRYFTWTMRSISHSVPLPLRNTSSGDIGMIVASEKIKGCTYVMYKKYVATASETE